MTAGGFVEFWHYALKFLGPTPQQSSPYSALHSQLIFSVRAVPPRPVAPHMRGFDVIQVKL